MDLKEKSELNESLRARLEIMVEKDQEPRQKLTEFDKNNIPHTSSSYQLVLKEMEEVDSQNTEAMKEIVDEHGWPGYSLVGKEGARLAWLLVQHADKDVDFQEKCLDLFKKAVEKGDAPKKNLAYLTDRVRLNRGKPQIFGTQCQVSKQGIVLRPVEDEDNLNARRLEYGLESVEDYLKGFKKIYEG